MEKMIKAKHLYEQLMGILDEMEMSIEDFMEKQKDMVEDMGEEDEEMSAPMRSPGKVALIVAKMKKRLE